MKAVAVRATAMSASLFLSVSRSLTTKSRGTNGLSQGTVQTSSNRACAIPASKPASGPLKAAGMSSGTTV